MGLVFFFNKGLFPSAVHSESLVEGLGFRGVGLLGFRVEGF